MRIKFYNYVSQSHCCRGVKLTRIDVRKSIELLVFYQNNNLPFRFG